MSSCFGFIFLQGIDYFIDSRAAVYYLVEDILATMGAGMIEGTGSGGGLLELIGCCGCYAFEGGGSLA